MDESYFKRSLPKSKIDSDLKNTKVNPDRLESYLLDSLWQNLPRTRNPALQKFQPCTPRVVQNHPVLQVPPIVPNPPRPMAGRFTPLDLPIMLHDLPQGYAQRVPFYDGQGNFTIKQHVDKFEYFLDLDQVDDDDVKMRLFVLSLLGKVNKWFKYFPSGSIHMFSPYKSCLSKIVERRVVSSSYMNFPVGL